MYAYANSDNPFYNEYWEGYNAYMEVRDGIGYVENPYAGKQGEAWEAGFNQAAWDD
jgi:hypothetical protein